MVRKVLVVEDDPAIQLLLTETLRSRGYEPRAVADGLEALPAASAMRPDIVLLDIGLPGIDGFEVLERLKADPELRDVPVIMVTAWGEPELMAKALDRGALDYVRKPFAVDDLLARVDAACKGAEMTPLAQAAGEVLRGEAVRVEVACADVEAVYGAGAGDEVLEALARRAAQEAGPGGSARRDGDTIMVTAPDCSAGELAERIRVVVARPVEARGAAIRVRASVERA
jgi:DNA-binding response OmpR family regulator